MHGSQLPVPKGDWLPITLPPTSENTYFNILLVFEAASLTHQDVLIMFHQGPGWGLEAHHHII